MHTHKIVPFAYKAIVPLALCLLLITGCDGEEEEARVELADPIGGSSIVTAADLLAFLERGESNTATLSADISLEQEMLRITKERDGLVINGNGFTLSGAGDCVIRLEDGCSVTLNDVVLHSGADAIGCLGDATIGGAGLSIVGLGNGIRAAGTVTVLPNSDIQATAINGARPDRHRLGPGGRGKRHRPGPTGRHGHRGLHPFERRGFLGRLYPGELQRPQVRRHPYHAGRRIPEGGEQRPIPWGGDRRIGRTGMVTHRAAGGENCSGLFLFEQLEAITVLGHCSPAPRFESGKGSITFVEDPADFPDEEEPAQTPAPEETQQKTEE